MGLIISILIIVSGSNVWAERKSLKKPPELQPVITSRSLEERFIGVNPKTGEKLYEPDLKPEVEFDKKTGNYIYHWIGRNGKKLTTVFEPRTKVDVIVKPEVKFSTLTSKYKYNYEVTNLKAGEQNLWVFAVEMRAGVSQVLNTVTKTPKEYMEWLKEEKKWMKQINIGIPESWRVSFVSPECPRPGVYGVPALTWCNDLHMGDPGRPGSSRSGFSFESEGLPGIVNCFAKGYTPVPKLPEGALVKAHGRSYMTVPEEVLDSTHKLQMKFQFVSGKTLGPVRIPELLIPENFVEYIISLSTESFSLGWIEKKKVFEELVNRLGAVKQTLISYP